MLYQEKSGNPGVYKHTYGGKIKDKNIFAKIRLVERVRVNTVLFFAPRFNGKNDFSSTGANLLKHFQTNFSSTMIKRIQN
jgi:hypothetical protein